MLRELFFFSVDYCNYCAHLFKFVFLNVELFVYILLIELPMHENDPETVDFFFLNLASSNFVRIVTFYAFDMELLSTLFLDLCFLAHCVFAG